MKNGLIILIILIVFAPSFIFPQKQISGLIVNKNGETISYAVISEILTRDGSLLTTVLSDSLGKFKINSSQNESFLYITNLGYKSQKVNFPKELSDIKIVLEVDTTIVLQEVVVKAQKPTMQIRPDRIIYDLSSNPLKDDNVLQALKFVPLINANNEGFSIIGKDNTLIYINGRKSNLNAGALSFYLASLPANSVKNIEVITTPNSTFRGEGSFGIINIQLKDNENDGLKGLFSGQVWKTHYFKESGNLNLSYQKNKLATNLNFGITNSSDWKNSSIGTLYKKDNLNTSTNTITDGDNLRYFASLATDYKLNDMQTLGFIVSTSFNDGNWTETGITKFVDLSLNKTDSILDIHYKSKNYNPEIAVNANYRISFDKSKQYLFVDLDYLNNYNKQESKNKMNYLDNNENIISLYEDYEQISPQKANVWSGKVEYGNSFDSQFNLKSGVDMYYSTIENDNQYKRLENGILVIDKSKSNYFEIKEWTPSLFMHLNKDWSKKISTSLGVRLEYTNYKGIQHASNENFENNYFKVLPNFYISYTPSPNHRINYNLSYRISRPPFSVLNPFVRYTSPTSYTKGNPFLNPAKRIFHNLQYMLLNKYYFTVSYNETKDVVNRIDIIKENNLIESKPVNLGKERNFSALFNTSFKYLNDNATLSLNLSYNWIQTRGSSEGLNLDYSVNSFNLYLNNYYQISKKYNLSFDFGINYGTKQKYSNLESPSYLDFNAQLRKKINNWQLSAYYRISTYLYDSKWSQKWKLVYDTNDLQKITYKWGGE